MFLPKIRGVCYIVVGINYNMKVVQCYAILCAFSGLSAFLLDGTDNGNNLERGTLAELTILNKTLQQNQASLQRLEQTMKGNFDIFSSQLNTKLDLQKKYDELTRNFSRLESELLKSEVKNQYLEEQLKYQMNETADFKSRIAKLEQHSNMKFLNDFSSMREAIGNITSDLLFVKQTQLSRSQDIISMFRDSNAFKENTNREFEKINKKMDANYKNANQTLETLVDKIDIGANNTYMLSQSLLSLTSRMETLEKSVALTACALKTQFGFFGTVVMFATIKDGRGFSNLTLSKFKTTGKLQIEEDGEYLLSVTLTAYELTIYYSIYKNDVEYVKLYEDDNEKHYQRGGITVTIHLMAGDKVWVKMEDGLHLAGGYGHSCLSLVKVG